MAATELLTAGYFLGAEKGVKNSYVLFSKELDIRQYYMIGAIHQLYFLPWLGYFSKIYFSEVFVVMDSVDFKKRHFYDRVKIINTEGMPQYISLPTGQNFKKSCNDVIIKDDQRIVRNKIIRTIEDSYAKALHYDSEWHDLKPILSNSLFSSNKLTEVNFNLIKSISEYLNLSLPKIIFLSSLDLSLSLNELIISICENVGIDELIMGDGKSTEVHNIKLLNQCGISILRQDYKSFHPIYTQSRRKRSGFMPLMSVVDCILNTGRQQTKDYIVGEEFRPKSYNHSIRKINNKKYLSNGTEH